MALEFPKDRHPNREEAQALLRACHDTREHIEQWNEYRRKNKDWKPDISDYNDRADLHGLTLCYQDDKGEWQGIDLSNADRAGTNLVGANASRATLSNANLSGGDLRKANFSGADLSGVNLINAQLTGANFSEVGLFGADFRGATFDDAKLCGAYLVQANLGGAYLVDANLGGARLHSANLSEARLFRADLRRADLCSADLTNTFLEGADLRDCSVDGETKLMTSKTGNCRIDRHTLDSLPDANRPSVADRRRMKIEDPVAMLRAAYGGFWQWIHLLAILVFLAPYAWFLASHWTAARFILDPGDDSLPLWECLLRYIYSGGTAWKDGWHLNVWPFAAFLVSVAYNALRLFMLWKTKTLELGQEVTGLPALYPLSGHRLWLYRLAKYGLWVNVLVVTYHTFHFLTQRVPL